MERQFGISMSPIVLDEPFDGLDSVGRELVVGLLGDISNKRQVVVIDHVNEIKSLFSTVISVDKRDGISVVSAQT
jgi:DNA repair exonuclease SbcCD ATPase subunit